jgi:hypothetical protein
MPSSPPCLQEDLAAFLSYCGLDKTNTNASPLCLGAANAVDPDNLQPLLLQTQTSLLHGWFDKLRDANSFARVKDGLSQDFNQPGVLRTQGSQEFIETYDCV